MSQKTNMAEKVKLLNNASYDIYLYHVMLIFVTTDLLNQFGIYKISERFALKMICVYSIIYIYCILNKYFQKLFNLAFKKVK